MTGKVFISYSTKDRTRIGMCLTALTTLQRPGVVEIFIDEKIEKGEGWDERIQAELETANIAVLFVSNDFLASEYVRTQELPRLFSRRSAGDVELIPVFLRPSQAERFRVEYQDARGNTRTESIASLQGIGQPGKGAALMDMRPPKREEKCNELAESIQAKLGAMKPLPPPEPSTPNPRRGLYGLRVDLLRRNGEVEVRCAPPDSEPFAARTQPWSAWFDGLEPLHHAIQSPDRERFARDLERTRNTWGQALFDALFGPASEHEQIFRRVFEQPDGPKPNPVWAPVRLHVETTDPTLASLPWQLLVWRDRPLRDEGWRITVGHRRDPLTDHALITPCNVLLIQPGGGDGASPADLAFTEVFSRVWRGADLARYVRTAGTPAEIEAALASTAFRLVYLRGTLRDDSSLELTPGDGGMALSRLVDLLRSGVGTEQWPSVVYANLSQRHPAGRELDPVNPALKLGELAPLVIWRRLGFSDPAAETLALTWLGHWLSQGGDPVEAWYEVLATAPVEAAGLCLHRGYRDWQMTVVQPSRRPPNARLALDRIHQKALTAGLVRHLIDSRYQRALALVAYADPGHGIASLNAQLEHYLMADSSAPMEVEFQALGFPRDRTDLRAKLETELAIHLDRRPGESIGAMLRRAGPGALPPKRSLLWLYWGAYGHRDGLEPAVDLEALGAWLRFTSEYLAARCPADLRIVCFVALETEPSNFQLIREELDELRNQPWGSTPSFSCRELDPLHAVTRQDLRDFFADPENTDCPTHIRDRMVQLLHGRTEGLFEPTVARIEQAERASWYDLLSELEGKAAVAPRPRKRTL